jgi:hypothetical protein
MQNFTRNKDVENQIFSSPKRYQLILSKINVKEKPVLKKYLTQFFETPQNYFVSTFSNRKIVLNKTKSINEIYEIPIPQSLLKRIKRRKSKGIQLYNDTSIKEKIAEIAVVHNNNTSKARFKKEKESKKEKIDIREIRDKEIQKIFNDFKKVRNINKNSINNFITKNEYVDLIHRNKNENEEKGEEHEQIEDKNNESDNNIKKLIKSKSSISIRKNKEEFEKNIIFSKITKYKDKNNNYQNNNILPITKKNSEKLIPKLSNQNNITPHFISIFDEINPMKSTIFKNEEKEKDNKDNNTTLNSQYSTLYKSRNKSFLSKLKNTLNKFQTTKSINNNELLIQKPNQYATIIKNKTIKKEFLKNLAYQEKTLQRQIQHCKKDKNMIKYIREKLKRENGELLMGQTDDYRIINDIKTRLNKLMKKSFPENHYDWKDNLRNKKIESDDINKDQEIMRNPYNKASTFIKNKQFEKYENEFIKKYAPKNEYRKFVKDIKNIKNNLNGLLIEGQNLLKYEHDLIKKIKGKKFLINYNNLLKEKDINDELYAYNIHINKYIKQ